MIFKLAQAFAIVCLFLFLTSVSVAESRPNAEKSSQRINIQFDYEGGQDPAAIWVSDGLEFRHLSAITKAVREFGVPEIVLSVVDEVWDPEPKHKPGEQHVAIRLTEGHADLFVTPRVPFKFTELLSMSLLEVEGIDCVRFRSVGRYGRSVDVRSESDESADQDE